LDNSFFLYLEQLELIAFFSGYSFIYLLIHFLSTNRQTQNIFSKRIVSLLPLAYALVGLSFLGYEIKKLVVELSIENIKTSLQGQYILLWGLLSVLFFIPVLYKKPVLSFLHSLIFFFLFAKYIFNYIFNSADLLVLKNVMNVYSKSLLLNSVSFITIVFISFLFRKLKNSEK
jgi:hypothetical protein